MIRTITFILMLAAATARAADWYLDNEAAGSNNGTSWANAWQNPTNIVWGASGVKAGDTLYVSGGTTTKTYTNGIKFGVAGSPGSPITVKVGQDAGHNGKAIFSVAPVDANAFCFQALTGGAKGHWIIIDGSRSASFTAPTSVYDIREITNNIGIQCTGPTVTNDTVQIAAIQFHGATNCAIRWVEVGPYGVEAPPLLIGGAKHGIRFQNVDGTENTTVEYCWIHDIHDDGINLSASTRNATNWDSTTFRWNIIERTADDGIQWGNSGLTIANCFFGDQMPWYNDPTHTNLDNRFYEGHPDHIQYVASDGFTLTHQKIINNVIKNKGNSLLIGEFPIPSEGSTIGNMFIAGNVWYCESDYFYATNTANSAWGVQAYGLTFDAWRKNDLASYAQVTFDNFTFINNTIVNQLTTPFKMGRAKPDPPSTSSAYRMDITNSTFANNLFLNNCWNPSANGPVARIGLDFTTYTIGTYGDPGSATNGIFYLQSEFAFNNNVFAKGAAGDVTVSWHTNENVAANLVGSNNSTNTPVMVATNTYDFRLTAADTVAKDAGYDLSSFTNSFPEFMLDAYGHDRFADGSPDIGAFEYTPETPEYSDCVTNGLVMWFTFDEDITDGTVTDQSGNGTDGLRRGRQSYPTNWPIALTWTNPITSTIRTGAQFRWYVRDGWDPTYNRSGDYIAVTNLTHIQSLTNATIMLWAMRNPAPDQDNDGLVEWVEDQGRYISGGYAYDGAWTVGMFSDRGDAVSNFRIYTSNSASADVYTTFGNATRVVTSGNTIEGSMGWRHLAVTFSNGVVATYVNTTNTGTGTVTNEALTIRGPSGGLDTGFLGLGCDTHNGKPWMEPSDDSGTQYPNHGWFNGGMDDVRIYNRVLSSNEIYAVVHETAYLEPTPEPDPDPDPDPDPEPAPAPAQHGRRMRIRIGHTSN